ncbi:hypothetical protein DRP53_09070 [candidate division WOR-3 bacterium]|uniref:Prepilin-type N-terminal cleavage/methylation domain-containing protein n=1 Tax=candidate division WOR-3 bacterium TaxID=2052148 RepID=A0A660SEQ1_UNCW3|nr:MAG: hypothetical protein DRP53_09070 [candidate division WOR-3 bacterium]
MRRNGFTLVEMLVVVVIFSLVAVFLTNYLLTERKQHEAYELMVQTRNNVLCALNIITHDLRILGADPEFTNQFNFLYQDNSGNFQTDHFQMLFTADINPTIGQLGDGSWSPSTETFGFYLQNNTIYRPTLDIHRNWTPNNDRPLVNGITNLTFDYRVWDEGTQQIIVVTDPTPSQLDDVVAVDVHVTGQSSQPLPTTESLYTFSAQTRVTLRTRLIGG